MIHMRLTGRWETAEKLWMISHLFNCYWLYWLDLCPKVSAQPWMPAPTPCSGNMPSGCWRSRQCLGIFSTSRGTQLHKWLKQKLIVFFCFSNVHLQMFSLLCAPIFLVRYAKGGRKTLHLLVNPPVLAAKRSISSTSSISSKWFWSYAFMFHHFPIFPPYLLVFSPWAFPGFLQLQRQHQRLRALSALVPRPGSGEFPFRAAAAAQRHHVGCHRGRHAAGPGTFGPSGHTTFSNWPL